MDLQDRKRQIAELAGPEALYSSNLTITTIQNDMNDPFNERRYHSNLFSGSEIAIENMLKSKVLLKKL
jgi:hypothetical protein